MSSVIDSKTDLRPIYEAKPDMRFATTFLSNKHRDYAVKGETIMDKVTGEIFTKRKEDGRVVSFFQNKKYLHDLMLELRILLNNNPRFVYPDEDNINAYYLSTDYDVMSINNEKDIDITKNNITINNNSANAVNHLKFKISTKSNGFFIRLTTRDSDSAIVEWTTNQYNALLKDYEGTNATLKTESTKFDNIEKWEDSNAVITYTVTYTVQGIERTDTCKDYIRINEESCVTFPSAQFSADILNKSQYVNIEIKEITFDKLHFLLTNKNILPSEITDGYNKFIYPDKAIYVRYINIYSFVDKSTDVELLGNEFIVALVDVPYCYRYMMKMNKLMDDNSFILSPDRPMTDIWRVNGIWAERLRDVFRQGVETKYNTEVDLKQLEDLLAANDDTDYLFVSTNKSDTNDIYGEEV